MANFVHNYCSNRPGVGLYLASELEYKSCIDLSFSDMECTESQLKFVGVICRCPNQNVNELMAKSSLENKLLLYNG